MSFQEKFAEKLIELGNKLKSVKLMEAKTVDGNIIISPDESLVENSEVMIRTSEGDLPLPVGEYTLEDGTMIVVETEGLVASVSAPSAEPQEEEEMEAQPKKITETVKSEVEFVEKADYETLKAEYAELKKTFEEYVESTNKNFEAAQGMFEKITNLLQEPVKQEKKTELKEEKKPMTTQERVQAIRNNLKIK